MTEDQIIKSITKNLIEFGYGSLTEDQVRLSYDKAMKGEKPKNIIDMMTAKQLDKNGLLPKFGQEIEPGPADRSLVEDQEGS